MDAKIIKSETVTGLKCGDFPLGPMVRHTVRVGRSTFEFDCEPGTDPALVLRGAMDRKHSEDAARWRGKNGFDF